MTGQLTMWGAGQILNTFFGQGASAPETYYLAMLVEEPSPYVSGDEIVEPAPTSGYSRMEIPNDVVHWGSDGTLNITFNLVAIQYVEAVADWGRVTHWALCSQPIDGEVYLVGELDAPVEVFAGDIVELDAGSLSVELGPFFSVTEV